MKKLIIFAALVVSGVQAGESPAYRSAYIGQEQRVIKTLSADDIADLNKGAGRGLAKAAELNGLPGPLHVLQMKKEIVLNPQQEKEMETLYQNMEAAAVPPGKQFIALEKELNQAFAANRMNRDKLRAMLQDIAKTRAELRYAHLAAHLDTPRILSPQQMREYYRLRGYTDDPCTHIPAGHDPARWRRHNACAGE